MWDSGLSSFGSFLCGSFVLFVYFSSCCFSFADMFLCEIDATRPQMSKHVQLPSPGRVTADRPHVGPGWFHVKLWRWKGQNPDQSEVLFQVLFWAFSQNHIWTYWSKQMFTDVDERGSAHDQNVCVQWDLLLETSWTSVGDERWPTVQMFRTSSPHMMWVSWQIFSQWINGVCLFDVSLLNYLLNWPTSCV